MHIDLLVTNMTLEYKVWLLHFSYYYVRLPASKKITSPTPERNPRTRALRGLRLSWEMRKATRHRVSFGLARLLLAVGILACSEETAVP